MRCSIIISLGDPGIGGAGRRVEADRERAGGGGDERKEERKGKMESVSLAKER